MIVKNLCLIDRDNASSSTALQNTRCVARYCKNANWQAKVKVVPRIDQQLVGGWTLDLWTSGRDFSRGVGGDQKTAKRRRGHSHIRFMSRSKQNSECTMTSSRLPTCRPFSILCCEVLGLQLVLLPPGGQHMNWFSFNAIRIRIVRSSDSWQLL